MGTLRARPRTTPAGPLASTGPDPPGLVERVASAEAGHLGETFVPHRPEPRHR
jgi:hypothetical protein